MKVVFFFIGGSYVCIALDNITRVKLINLVFMFDNIWYFIVK